MTTDQKPLKIALFASHQPGLKVAQYLKERSASDQVGALYLAGEQLDLEIVAALDLPKEHVFYGPDIIKSSDHIAWFREQGFDAVICVYWPWLLKPEIFSSAAITVNFHPALLPINRGWFPHVHSIIDGSKTGVTLHQLEERADTGRIWAQKEVLLLATDTAKDIYDRLQDEIVALFRASWPGIRSGEITPKPQDEAAAIYHKKNEIDTLDRIALDQVCQAGDLINRLRARTFGKLGFAYFEDGGEKIYVRIELSRTGRF